MPRAGWLANWRATVYRMMGKAEMFSEPNMSRGQWPQSYIVYSLLFTYLYQCAKHTGHKLDVASGESETHFFRNSSGTLINN